MSGVEDDGRLKYYDDVQIFSASYQVSNNIWTEYGQEVPPPTVDDCMKLDEGVVRILTHGRGKGAIY